MSGSTGPRPFGVGPYGTGFYSRWPNVIDLAASSGITFGLRAEPVLVFHPVAVTEIVFSAHAYLAWTWAGWQPCEAGTWQPAALCEVGGWVVPSPCSPGSWAPVRLP